MQGLRVLPPTIARLIGLLASLLFCLACAEEPRLGVQAFALNPALSVTSPTNLQVFNIKPQGATDITVEFLLKKYTLGTVHCYLDGALNGVTGHPANDKKKVIPYTFKNVPQGMHTLGFVLATDKGLELTNPDARAIVKVLVVSSCSTSLECDDGLACSEEKCVGGTCQYGLVVNCCGSTFDCAAGDACLAPNTTKSKCSWCGKQSDCDDGEPCTQDVCDLSGAKGVCTHSKPKADCCSKKNSALCDDGKSCTVDACDLASGKCTHKQVTGACCTDSECTATDVCKVGVCLDDECRFAPDKFKPGCCHVDLDCPSHACAVSKCNKAMATPDKWKQCTQVPDTTKTGPNGEKCCDPTNLASDCNDDDVCTWDVCSGFQCQFKPVAECCHPSKESKDKVCDDGEPCTLDICQAPPNASYGKCVHKKIPGCCTQSSHCDDGLYCNEDICDVATLTCSHKKGSDGCCDNNAQCDDGKSCTVGWCVNLTCLFAADSSKPEGCCDANGDCDDGNLCTTDVCDLSGGGGVCVNKANADCCEEDAQCDDGKSCTQDKCWSNKCKSSAPAAGCCADDPPAKNSCDDLDKCTIDYCANGHCHHHGPAMGCCLVDSDCDDGDTCTTGTCKMGAASYGKCVFVTTEPNCLVCTPADADIKCDDKNLCTKDSCINNMCTHELKKDCCEDAIDCNDNDPCTFDGCVFNQCWHSKLGGKDKLCYTPATEGMDCNFVSSECASGKCMPQPDGVWACEAVAKPVCTVNVGYCQDFELHDDLPKMGWTPVDILGKAAGNWGVYTDNALGPDQHARLTWAPVKVNYDTCLASPVINAIGVNSLSVQFDLEFIKQAGTSTVRLLGGFDGDKTDWTKAVVIEEWGESGTLYADTIDLKLPPSFSNANNLRLAFCVTGESTYDLAQVGLDNFCLARGNVPAMACPANMFVEVGGIKTVRLWAKDGDLDAIVSLSLVKAPPFVTLAPSTYYWLDSTWNAQLRASPKSKDDVGDHEITVKVSDGFFYRLCTFQITVLYKGGVLVWRPPEVPKSHSEALVAAIKDATSTVVQVTDDISIYASLKPFDAVFVTLGVYPDNHVLMEAEIASLKLYLYASGKGRLYLEGGDTWAFDKPTSLHPLFQVEGVADSATLGVTGPMVGIGPYNQPSNALDWGYSQDFAFNNLNDKIAGKTAVQRTRNLLGNAGAEPFVVHVGHDNKAASYRTIASSVAFAGLIYGNSPPVALMKRLFSFFDNGVADCKADKDCDDGIACSVDTCNSSGECAHSACGKKGPGP